MAESEFPNEFHPRRSVQQNIRPPYRGRGRGRGRFDPHVMKALHNFGVRDLREILDRKHQEEQLEGGPPVDPSYNYLSDPERDNPEQEPLVNINQRGSQNQGVRGRGNLKGREKRQAPIYIQKPLNIKVQFSTSTGQRSYSVDQETRLDDIKHIPDHIYSDNKRPSDDVNWRGRPRGKGRGGERRGRGRFPSMRGRGAELAGTESETRAKSVERSDHVNENDSRNNKPRGRGKYTRSRSADTRGNGESKAPNGETRGRGGRGTGYRRGQGRNRNHSDSDSQDMQAVRSGKVPEVPTEENWDTGEATVEKELISLPQVEERNNETEGNTTGGQTECGILRDEEEKGDIRKKRSVRFDLQNNESKLDEDHILPHEQVVDDGVEEIESQVVSSEGNLSCDDSSHNNVLPDKRNN